MLLFRQILVSTFILATSALSLTACGQQGPLYLPTAPAATKRATLPESLRPFSRSSTTPTESPAATLPAKPTSAPQ